ncbi:MAG: aspartate kinase [Acidobacteria bacterium]|nr:aspartate kinase [Acidobacteriota bacterium]
MNNLLIMKFGGTSMGSAARIRVAADLTAAQQRLRPTAIVVSAMSKVTDLLLDTLRHAENNDADAIAQNVATLRARHHDTARELLDPAALPAALAEIDSILGEFERIAKGMQLLGDRPPRSVDEAIAVGERLSAILIAAYLNGQGTPAAAINSARVVITDAVHGNATPLLDLTRAKAAEHLAPLLAAGTVPVLTGFNGATADGKPTTLGRGGSDFSASIFAYALDAAELWIWTDVDGIMSADPRLVPDAKVLDEVTYAEAAELAYNGAKVLHPRTLAPLVEKKIPVWSKNSFNVAAKGTHIAPALSTPGQGARAVTSMANVAMVSVEPASAEIPGTRIMARALDALALVGAEVLTFSSSSYRQSFCFLIRKDELQVVLQALRETLALELEHGYVRPVEVDDNVGLIAVVGEGMRGQAGLAGRVFTAVSREQVNIIAIAQGSSELTINLVVPRSGIEKAVKAIHAECGMGR